MNDDNSIKIDKILEWINKVRNNSFETILPDGRITDVGYYLVACEDIEKIIKGDDKDE